MIQLSLRIPAECASNFEMSICLSCPRRVRTHWGLDVKEKRNFDSLQEPSLFHGCSHPFTPSPLTSLHLHQCYDNLNQRKHRPPWRRFHLIEFCTSMVSCASGRPSPNVETVP